MQVIRAMRIVPLSVVVLCLASPMALAQDWRPVLKERDKDKEISDPKKLNDKEWLKVGYTDFTGFKPSVGVVISQEKVATTGEVESDWAKVAVSIWGKQGSETNPFNHIEDMVRQALGATNRFTMVERTTATEDVIGEQDFGASGRVDQKSAAKIGKMKGAKYTVKATVIELNPEKDSNSIKAVGGGMGSSALGIGSVGVSGKVAFCRLNVRVINSETGEISQDVTVDGTAKSSGLSLGGGAIGVLGGGIVGGGAGVENKKAALMSDAMQACANKIAYTAAMKFKDLPWQGMVASVSGSKININGGTNVGLRDGLVLELFSKGDPIVDPETKETLGYSNEKIGQLRVVSAQEKFATCEIIEGGTGVKDGDIVRLAKTN